MKRSNVIFFLVILGPLWAEAQVFSTPGGAVSNNGTTDVVNVEGVTKLVNPNGRTLMIERDDEDSWLTFHDPDQYWYSMGIDRSNSGAFTLNSGGALGYLNHFVMTTSGNVGIGTPTPTTRLEVNGNFQIYPSANAGSSGALKLRVISAPSASIIEANSDYVWANHDIIINAANSASGNTNQLVVHRSGHVGIGIQDPMNLLDVNGVGRFRSLHSAESGFTIGEDALTLHGWGTNNPYIQWVNADAVRQGYMGWNTNRLSLVLENGYNFTVENGNVGIGTTSPTEKLTVNGTVHSKEVKVDLSVPGPDYVFNKDYDLLSLDEVKAYIEQNNHLPDVPSAEQMESEGINLGQMNILLLKKIEEMTLYIIELKKENQEIKSQLEKKKDL